MANVHNLDPRAANLNPNALRVAGIQLLEADPDTAAARGAAGTVNADVVIPAYAVLYDIVAYAEAVWDDGTSATLDVGIVGDDTDTFFSALNLKATDLTADQSVSFSFAGGDNGTSLATSTHVLDRVDTAARTIRATANIGGGDGTAGKTYIYVIYGVPEMDMATYTAS
jgi:hypothetical protein